MPGTRKLGRTSDSRNAMMRAMVTYLLENGKIETTVTRAKDVRSMAEKMITLGKASDLHTKRQVYAYITKEDVAKKLFDEISPKYADRNGGYTRIIRIAPRKGDAITGMPAEAVRDVGVERAGTRDVAGHGGETDREQQQHRGADDVRTRVGRPVAGGDADREGAGDDGQRSGGGDDHEHDGHRAEPPRQSVGLSAGASTGIENCVSCHDSTFAGIECELVAVR